MVIDVAAYEELATGSQYAGEGPATAYYYEAYLNGDNDWIGDFTLHSVTDEEREAFGLPATCPHYLILQDGQGVIRGYPSTDERIEELREDGAAEDATDE